MPNLQQSRRTFVHLGKSKGPYHHALLPITISLAKLYQTIPDSDQIVLSFVQHANKILSSKVPHPKAEVAIRYCRIVARLYKEVDGNYEKQASALMRHSSTIAKSRFGESSIETASCNADCAVYFIGVAQFSTALHFAGRALVIFMAKLGPSHRCSAQAQYQVGLLYRLMENYEKAVEELQYARKMFTTLYGESLEVARADVSLGFSFHMSKRYLQAERCYERALSVREDKLGPDHTLTAEARGLLGEVQLVLGRFSGVPTKQYNVVSESASQSHLSNDGGNGGGNGGGSGSRSGSGGGNGRNNGRGRQSMYGHGARGYDSSEIMEALASVGRRTHIPLDISTGLLEASAANKITAHQVNHIVQELGDNNDFYTFLANAISNEVNQKPSLHAAVGQKLSDLFGSGSGYGVAPVKDGEETNKQREIMFYGTSIRHAIDTLNGESRRAGKPAAVGGTLSNHIQQVIADKNGSSMSMNEFVSSVEQIGGGLDSKAIGLIKERMLQNVPYSGTMKELQAHIAQVVPSFLGLGGFGAGELTLGSSEMLLNAIQNINYLQDDSDPLISTQTKQDLLNAMHSNNGISLREIQKLSQGSGLAENISKMMRSKLSELHRETGGGPDGFGTTGMNNGGVEGSGGGGNGSGGGDGVANNGGGGGGGNGDGNRNKNGTGGYGNGDGYENGYKNENENGNGNGNGNGGNGNGGQNNYGDAGFNGNENGNGTGAGQNRVGGHNGNGAGNGSGNGSGNGLAGNDGTGGNGQGQGQGQGQGEGSGSGPGSGPGSSSALHTDQYGPLLDVVESDSAVRRDSVGRRVKVLALDGKELFGLFRNKFAAFGSIWSHHKTVRKRRHAHCLLSAGIFQHLLTAKVRQRRALRLLAMGMMYARASERRLCDVGDSLVSMGFFSGLQMAAIESKEKLDQFNKNKKTKRGVSKFKTVNLSKDDVIDSEKQKNSLWGQKHQKQKGRKKGRRDSFMILATEDLEKDFAKKQAKKATGPKKAKKVKADLLPEKEGKKMSFVAFTLTKQHTWEDLADIIEELDIDAVPLDALEALKGICPLITRFKKKVLDWKVDLPDGTKVEPSTEAHFKMMTSAELMVFHLGKVEGLEKAAESMLFVKSFDEQLKPLDKSLNKLIHACKEVTASVRLEPILRYGTFIFDGDDVVVVVYILLHIYIDICFFAIFFCIFFLFCIFFFFFSKIQY